jgi:DNA-binding transcriptional LysR family regulator
MGADLATVARLRDAGAQMDSLPMFDWNDLRHFLAVARHGGTLAAAKSLKVSHSTVHRRLEELERKIGRNLVERRPTGYRLTELGQEMRAYAERVEEAVMAFERRLAAAEMELVGTLRVTCPEAFGSRLMGSPFLGKFNARYPSLHVEFVVSDKLLDLGKRQADIAIRGATPTDQTLFGRKIGDIPWAVYASKSYIERHGSAERLEDMDHHTVIGFGGEMSDHHTVRWLRSTAPKAKVAARSNSLPALILAVKSGVGIAPLPVIVGENESELVRLFGPVRALATPFYLLMHNDLKTTPRVRAFFDFFIEELPEVRKLLTMGISAEA